MQNTKETAVLNRTSPNRISVGLASLTFLLIASGFVDITVCVAEAQTVTSVSPMGQLTGVDREVPEVFSDEPYNAVMCESQEVFGTDLGISYSFIAGGQRHLRFLFGDTFGRDVDPRYGNGRLQHRSNTMATSTDSNPENGITDLHFLWMSNDLPLAGEVIPLWEYSNCGLFGPCQAVYPTTGLAVPYNNGIREYIYAAAFATILPSPLYFESRWWYSDDGWTTHHKTDVTDAFNPNWQLAAAARGRGNQDGYMYFYGIPCTGGTVQLIRIRETDITSWLVPQNRWPTRFPQKYTVRGWRPWSTYLPLANVIDSAGPGSIMWIGDPIGKYIAFTSDYIASSSLEVRFAPAPEGPWSNVAWSQGHECPFFKETYYPYMIPEYTDCDTNTGSCTIYFILSRMSPGDYGAFASCSSYDCGSNTWSPDPCHQVYNAFLMKMTVEE